MRRPPLRVPRRVPGSLRRRWGPNWLLAALLLAALALRLYGIDWDGGQGFHPDERSFYLRADDMFRALTLAPGYERWVEEWPGMEAGIPDFWTALSAERSPLNPHWFPLGSALIYALVLVRSIAEPFTDWGAMDLRFAGRALAALADAAAVGMMYVVGRRMYGTGAGLAAAAGTAFAVVHIQHAHFYRPEPFSALAALGALWAMLRLIDGRRRRDALLLGALTGLTLATKIAAAPIILPLLLAFLWVAKDRAGGHWRNLTPRAAARVLPLAGLTGGAALAMFFITTPYALLDWPAFVEDIGAQAEMAREAGHWPFTWQYADAPAFLYQIRQTTVWGLGLPLGIAVWLAAPFTAWLAWRGGLTQRADWLLLAWAVPAFVFLELFEVKFLRYIFPLLPFYILMAARMLTAGVAWAAGRRAGADTGGGADTDADTDTDFIPGDAPFSEEWHATPPLVGDDALFDEPLAGDGDDFFSSDGSFSGDAPFSEEWHATPPLAGAVAGGRPATAISEGAAATRRGGRSRLVDRWAYPAAVALLAMVLGATALYAVAFASIYGQPHTAIAAAEWLNANAPAGASIINAGSLWDERIPDLGRYEVWEFPAYHRPDDAAKIGELAERMADADYLIFYSNRAYGSVARLPGEFPRSAAFYRQLFRGELGYRLERGFTSYPALAGVSLRDDPYRRAGLAAPPVAPGGDDGQPGGIVINLGYADENVIGYDHPQALVFRNTEGLTADALGQRIAAGAAGAEETPALMLTPAARAAQQSGGTWSEAFSREGWGSRAPWLTWLLAVYLIGLAAFPLTWWLLRPLPDRGALFARVVGLLLAAWVVWMLVSAGAARYTTGAIWLGLLTVAVPSAVVVWRQWREMLQWLRRKWGLALTGEALFLLAYLAFVMIRAANPDLWHPWRGGEKPMELAYFTAVARSSVMPPYDPWFSGGYLNYYYWGYFILSVPARLTGIAPATAFNLAAALLFALTATGAGSLAYNLVAAARRGTGEGGDAVKGASGRAWRRRLPGAAAAAGLLGAVMAAVAGNLDGVAQLLQMTQARVQGMAAPLSEFDFWRSSRAIPELEEFEPTWLTPWIERRDWMESGFHITEFPYFTFLFADLHAHMMTMPFALLGLALGFALLAGLPAWGWRRLWPWATAAALGLAVGSLWAINSWEYPAYALLAMGVIAAAAWLTPGTARTRPVIAVGLAGLALAAGYAAFLPFHAATETFGTGIEATRWRTPLFNYVLIHALPLLAAYALLSATLPQAARPLLCRIRGGAPLPAAQQWLLAGVAVGILLAIYCGAAGFATACCLAALLTLTVWALAARLACGEDDAARHSDIMALGMMGMALAIGIGVEFVRVEGDIGRMNTVFKYYLVAWLLFAGAGAYGFWRGWSASRSVPLRWAVGGMAGLVAAGVLVYPALATPVRIADRFGPTPLTLDGAAWMDEARYHISEGWCGVDGEAPAELARDAGAIRWLQDNVLGTPVILEAHGNQYCWNGRMSAYTGLPTVLGWPWHQTQQRGDEAAIRARADDVATLYNTTDPARARRLLDRYGIAYIVVGDLERAFYDSGGIAKFERMADGGALALEYAKEGTRIYRVE